MSSVTSRKLKAVINIIHLPAVCKAGGILISLLLQISCRWCGGIFCICRCCWRGQAYCSTGCRRAGKLHAHREAQRRYRRTFKGKKAHREAERRRRMRISKKTMADRGSTNIPLLCKLNGRRRMRTKGRCRFCGHPGRITDKFPRRGYGKHRNQAKKGGDNYETKKNSGSKPSQTY